MDVTVAGSQKGLMLPPGLSFNAVSDKALAASRSNQPAALVLGLGGHGQAQPDRLLSVHAGDEPPLGLREAIAMLEEEGLQNVFARHARHGEATRRARCADGGSRSCARIPQEYSNSLTAVLMPAGHDADRLRETILDRYDMSLGAGLAKLAGQGVSHRPPWRLQRFDARGHARRRRDGTCSSPAFHISPAASAPPSIIWPPRNAATTVRAVRTAIRPPEARIPRIDINSGEARMKT